MSGVFSKPERPRHTPHEPITEDIQVIEEDAGTARRRERKKLLKGGRTSMILSGITSALKKRLGE